MRDELILDLIGRGESTDELHETIRIGWKNGLAGYWDPGKVNDFEQVMRDMERRGLVRRVGWDWHRAAEKREGVLFQ